MSDRSRWNWELEKKYKKLKKQKRAFEKINIIDKLYLNLGEEKKTHINATNDSTTKIRQSFM